MLAVIPIEALHLVESSEEFFVSESISSIGNNLQ